MVIASLSTHFHSNHTQIKTRFQGPDNSTSVTNSTAVQHSGSEQDSKTHSTSATEKNEQETTQKTGKEIKRNFKAAINHVESELSEAEQKQVRELKARDREVRAHEQAHLTAAGSLARGGPSFEYQRGPDGQNYAVGGEVQVDTSPAQGDPQATILKAQKVRRAALAPAQPSGQDLAIAAQATAMETRARMEIAQQKLEDSEGEKSVAETKSTDENTTAVEKRISEAIAVTDIVNTANDQSGKILDLIA